MTELVYRTSSRFAIGSVPNMIEMLAVGYNELEGEGELTRIF